MKRHWSRSYPQKESNVEWEWQYLLRVVLDEFSVDQKHADLYIPSLHIRNVKAS